MYKRLIALVLAAAMLTALLAGCGSSGKETNNPGQNNPVQTQPVQTDPVQTEPAQKVDYTGFTDGDQYHNPHFGISFTAASGWYICDEAQLAELNSITADIYGDLLSEELNDSIAEGGSATIMSAGTLSYNGDNVNMVVTKSDNALLSLSPKLFYETMASLLQDQLASIGITDSTIEVVSITFLGEETYALLNTLPSLGVSQLQVYQIVDGYSCAVTATSANADDLERIISRFYAYGEAAPVISEPEPEPTSEPTGDSLNLPDGFMEDGVYAVTYEQAAMMINLELVDQNMFMGFDGVSDDTAYYTVVTADEMADLSIWGFASLIEEDQPIDYLVLYTPVDNTDENLELFTRLICVACSAASPTLDFEGAAQLLADAEDTQLEDGSPAKVVYHEDLLIVLTESDGYLLFYIM